MSIFLVSSLRAITGTSAISRLARSKSFHPVADISLFIGERDRWGNGYATEAITAVSRHAIGELCIGKLSASMYAQNIGSYKAFLKASYKREGLRRAHYWLDGEPRDLIELGFVVKEWNNRIVPQARSSSKSRSSVPPSYFCTPSRKLSSSRRKQGSV